MKIIHKNKDITELVTKIEWSGDYKQAARQLNFNVVTSQTDNYLQKVTIQMGDIVKLLDNEKEIFQGYVFSKEKSINNSQMTISCYDGLIYLLKSKGTYNFKNMPPEAITQKVASDFNIPVGNLEKGSNISRIFDEEYIYNIIMTSYTIESKKSNKIFMAKMEKGKLNVILKGKTICKFILDSNSTIIDSTYGENIENSINKVKIYDELGKFKGEVKNDEFPGILQEIYKEEKGIDTKTAAKNMLKGIEKTATIEALGNLECITGNSVLIKEPLTGLKGLFFIDNDTHIFENGQHKMNLGLSFKNMMDTQ